MDEFRTLSARDRVLVAVAVLLDGIEAGNYLANDSQQGEIFKVAADKLAALQPEMRMPLAGTLLRTAIRELKSGNNRYS